MCVAEKLKYIVEERGTTYTFLSKRTGIKVDAISKSLSGKRRLPADEMIALCRALNVDLCDLDFGAERETNKNPIPPTPPGAAGGAAHGDLWPTVKRAEEPPQSFSA